MQETIITDPVTGGAKGSKPERLGAVDPRALRILGRVAAMGAEKYATWNFLKGFDWALAFDAMQRHSMAFWEGEDLDPESGLPHMAHAAWHALCLVSFQARELGTDSRYVQPDEDDSDPELLGEGWVEIAVESLLARDIHEGIYEDQSDDFDAYGDPVYIAYPDGTGEGEAPEEIEKPAWWGAYELWERESGATLRNWRATYRPETDDYVGDGEAWTLEDILTYVDQEKLCYLDRLMDCDGDLWRYSPASNAWKLESRENGIAHPLPRGDADAFYGPLHEVWTAVTK